VQCGERSSGGDAERSVVQVRVGAGACDIDGQKNDSVKDAREIETYFGKVSRVALSLKA